MSSDLDIAMGIVWGIVGAAVLAGLGAFTYYYYRERPEQIPRPPKLPPPEEQWEHFNQYVSRRIPRRPRRKFVDPDIDPEGAAEDAAAGDPFGEAEAEAEAEAEFGKDYKKIRAQAAQPPEDAENQDADASASEHAPRSKWLAWLAAFKGAQPPEDTDAENQVADASATEPEDGAEPVGRTPADARQCDRRVGCDGPASR